MKRIFRQLIFTAFAAALLLPAPARAQNERERRATHPDPTATAKQQKEAAKKSESAARVFDQVMGAPDRGIPRELLDRAEAVAVFPGVLKAGFVVGGRGGSGLISRRVTGGWSAPAFFKLGGASVGLQVGASKTDFVLLFMNEDAVRGLLAGLELKGAVINPDNNLNEALYGLKARDLLTGSNKVAMADVLTGVIVFPNTLARYSVK